MSQIIYGIIEYYNAQICLNGHVISATFPEQNTKFCSKCGSPTIVECLNCKTPIRGSVNTRPSVFDFKMPYFCHNCGHPYPWTTQVLKATELIAEEDEALSQDEKSLLIESMTELTSDTAMTTVAANRVKKILVKVGKGTADALYKIIVDIGSEVAKKIIFGN